MASKRDENNDERLKDNKQDKPIKGNTVWLLCSW